MAPAPEEHDLVGGNEYFSISASALPRAFICLFLNGFVEFSPRSPACFMNIDHCRLLLAVPLYLARELGTVWVATDVRVAHACSGHCQVLQG